MTFRELFDLRHQIIERKAIYKHLAEYLQEFISEDFRSANKNILIEEDKIVNENYILEVKNGLEKEVEECNTKLQEIDQYDCRIN